MLWKFLLISLKATCLSFAPASSTLINASPISDFEKSQVPDSLYVKDSATKIMGVSLGFPLTTMIFLPEIKHVV